MALGDKTDPILIKQSDTRPKIRGTAWQGDVSVPINLTGATAVFSMRNSTSLAVVASRQTATVADATGGIVEYALTAAQTATAGDYQAEFELTLSDGGILTLPTGDNYIWVKIGDDIA
jgi:hypothetical protein